MSESGSGGAGLGVLTQEVAVDPWGRGEGRDLRPLRRLIPFVRAHPVDAILGLIFIALSSAAALAMTSGLKYLVDHGPQLQNQAVQLHALVVMGSLTVVLAVTTGFRLYFTYKLGERVVADLRRVAFRHVLGLDLGHFRGQRTGEVLSRLTSDMTMVEAVVGNTIPVGLRNFVILVGALIGMVVISPNLTGLVLLLIPLLVIPLLLMSRKMQQLSARAQDRFAEAIGYAGEGLGALDTVQAFGQEDFVSARFNRCVETAFEASRVQMRARGWLSGMMIALIFAGMLALLAMALNFDPNLKGGAPVQLLALAFFAANAVKDLSEVWGQIQKGSGAAQRIAAMMDATSSITAPAYPTPLPARAGGEVRFENVRFGYRGRDGAPALAGFSLLARPGERVALVGPSGAGKSTVFRLLLRFYDPDSGVVRLDGVDLRQADPREVRARMAVVAQDAPLFSGSAADNIRFGFQGATPADVRAAAAAAQAEGFLSALPQGFETPVGEQAKSLSGGQRQRIAIARALIRRSPVLLLDEATSALDAESERLVQQALQGAMAGRTTLVIAHRLATVLEADRIVVMDAGRVVEEGRHAELFARGGLYARLAKLQFGAEAA